MTTPFYDAIAALSRRGPRFFVPGHKGNGAAVPVFADLLRWDLTEVAGADDLSRPCGPLLQSERNMARAFGAGATLYSAFGAGSCVQAMLALFARPGQAVVMARGCHVSALRALALLDLRPIWVPLHGGRVRAADIEAALRQSGAKTVFITAMDYDGRAPDVAAIAEVCQRWHAALLCDNAQGTHRQFLPGDAHPLALGADAVADSAHKTLPCLTPAALLHLRDKALAGTARQCLNLFCSTSPAYPVLLSLDLAAGRLLAGDIDFAAAVVRLAALARALAPFARPAEDDALRLVVWPHLAGRSAADVGRFLLAAGVAAEYADAQHLVFMASPFNTEADFDALQTALMRAVHETPPTGAAPPGREANTARAPLPRAVQTPRQALFGPRERVDVRIAAGRIAAGLEAPCPPGVPLVVPGEMIDETAAAALLAGGILRVDVVK